MSGPVLFCGDPHAKFRHIIKYGTEPCASAVVLLGEMEPARPLDIELQLLLVARIPVYLIRGNHDTYSEALNPTQFSEEIQRR